jgi:MSHA biogenesis protein MshQ
MKYSDCYACLLKKMLPLLGCAVLLGLRPAYATMVELNNTGGTTTTNGLHFYIDDSTHMQVRRLNNSGQVYPSGTIPPSNSLDNGVFLRSNGRVYGPSHTIGGGYTPNGGMFSSYTITPTSPANPATSGVQQIATSNIGVVGGIQLAIAWKYTTPLDFLTADVTLIIPATVPVSAFNPIRYFHVFDTFLGGSDQGCGIKYTDGKGNLVVGTYLPTSSGTCPSSSSIPVGVTIFETFRERSGMKFSSYCAAGWQSFYVAGGVNCAVPQFSPFSNTIVTSYQDTGIGATYDFIAPGTYTFSYDFVIGTTVVPAYDHIEIVHDGSASLCPETVKVIACTTAGVPCAPGNIVSAGTITGNLTVTPAAPAVTVTPTSFSIGGAGSSANVVLKGSGAGVYTLSATNISGTPPLNGTKCSNGDIATSCILTITNTPCVANFECQETATTYNIQSPSPAVNLRNPLYTKLVGTDFKFDVLALQSTGAVATTYTGSNVTVELFDDSATPALACNALSSPVSTQQISFLGADLGRKTLTTNINLTKAYRKLRCRVTDTSIVPAVSACSSDRFTVRPKSFDLISSTNVAVGGTGSDASVLPAIKAGLPFNLNVNTSTAGYDGLPTIDPTLLEWPVAPAGGRSLSAPEFGTGTNALAGSFSSAAAIATGNGASGNAFTYNEVGYFRFKPQGVYDNSFTAYSNDSTIGICTVDAANPCDCTPNESNTADASGKYGCKFGNAVTTDYFGRFIPHHFTLVSSSLSDPAITPSACVAAGVIYMDQPFTLSAIIEARNLANTATLNYNGAAFGKVPVIAQVENANSGVAVLNRLILPNPVSPPIPSVQPWVGGRYSFIAKQFTRLTPADGPYDALTIGVSVADEAGVLLIERDMDNLTSSTCTPDSLGTSDGNCTGKNIIPKPVPAPVPSFTPTIKMRHGRLKLSSVYGSERLKLAIPIKLEYWNGTAWAVNTLDTCSAVAASNFSLSFPNGTTAKPNNLAACETALSLTGLSPAQSISLSAPGTGNNGWTDVTLNLVAPSGNQCSSVGAVGAVSVGLSWPWLQYHWTGAGTALQNPTARATFGIFKKANEFIYLRELY